MTDSQHIRTVLDSTHEEWTARNSHGLTYTLLRKYAQALSEERHQHREFREAMHTFLTRSERVLAAVLKAKRAGRKTVRIDDLEAS